MVVALHLHLHQLEALASLTKGRSRTPVRTIIVPLRGVDLSQTAPSFLMPIVGCGYTLTNPCPVGQVSKHDENK
jgi:hypothetical protein